MERKCTNLSSLYFCCGFVVLLFILMGYSATQSDLDRLTKGYDDCGNICGRKDNKDLQIPGCSNTDMSLKPKVKVGTSLFTDDHTINVTIVNFSCIEKCEDDYEEIYNRCFKREGTDHSSESLVTTISQELIQTWPKILLSCFVAFIFSYIVLILFRYAIKYIIYIIFLGLVIVLAGATIVFLIIAIVTKFEEVYLFAAAFFAIPTLIFGVIYWAFRKRIEMTAELFKETSKALVDVPAVMFEPILTFLTLLFAIIPFIVFMILIETAGDAVNDKNEDDSNHVIFEQNVGVQIARVINFVAFIWFTQFIYGCQHFVIAGTVSKWYFTRDKKKLDSPVLKSFNHLLRFHLGSVCLGSMIITLVKILRMLIEGLKQIARKECHFIGALIAGCLSWMMGTIEELLKYLMRNAYILVAKDGTPFVESGRKAFKLLFEHLVDVISLNFFGDILLFIARLFVTVITTFIAYEIIKDPELPSVFVSVLLCAIFAFLISHCFVTVFEMAVDTIFLCFCDDILENDGGANPYFMSQGLMDVMRKLKQEAGGDFNFGAQEVLLPRDPKGSGMYPTLPADQKV